MIKCLGSMISEKRAKFTLKKSLMWNMIKTFKYFKYANRKWITCFFLYPLDMARHNRRKKKKLEWKPRRFFEEGRQFTLHFFCRVRTSLKSKSYKHPRCNWQEWTIHLLLYFQKLLNNMTNMNHPQNNFLSFCQSLGPETFQPCMEVRF